MCVHIERGVSIARACSTDYNEPIQRRGGALPKKARERLARDRTRSPEVNIFPQLMRVDNYVLQRHLYWATFQYILLAMETLSAINGQS